MGIGGIVLAVFCFGGAVGAVVIRTWIWVLRGRKNFPGPRLVR